MQIFVVQLVFRGRVNWLIRVQVLNAGSTRLFVLTFDMQKRKSEVRQRKTSNRRVYNITERHQRNIEPPESAPRTVRQSCYFLCLVIIQYYRAGKVCIRFRDRSLEHPKRSKYHIHQPLFESSSANIDQGRFLPFLFVCGEFRFNLSGHISLSISGSGCLARQHSGGTAPRSVWLYLQHTILGIRGFLAMAQIVQIFRSSISSQCYHACHC